MEAQRPAALVYQLPGRTNAERGTSGIGGGQFTAHGVLQLPRARAAYGRGEVV